MRKIKGGHGVVSRNIMMDPTLPVESKAIYSILASMAGDKDRCFPTIKKLLEVTDISKRRLYKYLDILVQREIVERVLIRESGCYKNVVYKIHDESCKTPFPQNGETSNCISPFCTTPFPQNDTLPFPQNDTTPFPQNSTTNNNHNNNSHINNNHKNNNQYSAPLVQNEEMVNDDEWEDPEESLRKWEAWKAQQEKESNKNRSTKFIPPTVEAVEQYCEERHNNISAQAFVDFYTAKGWMIGKNKMKDWKAAVRTWERGRKQNAKSKTVFEEWGNA